MPKANPTPDDHDAALQESAFSADPIRQFRDWMSGAAAAGLPMPEAATLATATPDGRPSARMVLLKDYDQRGFTFFTNYRSRKARELDDNPFAAVVLYWPELQRQIRIEGEVERLTHAESDAYFRTRPLESRLGAWASPQSEVIAGRDELEKRLHQIQSRFPGDELPCPEFWGGYRLRPTIIEFWQGRPGRLHDRLRYRFEEKWLLDRLAP